MTKQAHISCRLDQKVGDKVLGLCGKEFKIKVLWEDIPRDKPICRRCVDTALETLTEADALIQKARTEKFFLMRRADSLNEALNAETTLDRISMLDQDHLAEQELKAKEKAEKNKAEHSCTCVWQGPEIRVESPDCPIHKIEEPKGELE